MAIEFERKFLINNINIDDLTKSAQKVLKIKQGYYIDDKIKIARIRQSNSDWFLTFKENSNEIGKNIEFEFKIREDESKEAEEMFNACQYKLEKTRYCINYKDLIIELDIFDGANAGLIMAEVEFKNEDESLWLTANMPSYFVEEVTGDKRYSNINLAKPNSKNFKLF